jgi:hypothetical protein
MPPTLLFIGYNYTEYYFLFTVSVYVFKRLNISLKVFKRLNFLNSVNIDFTLLSLIYFEGSIV